MRRLAKKAVMTRGVHVAKLTRASACQVREEELVASLTAAVGTMTHAQALAKLHSSMPADALADDKKAYEMLQKMVIEVQK